MSDDAVERVLAAFAANGSWSSMPPAVRERSTDILLDAIACAIAGRTAPARESFAETVDAVTGPGDRLVVADAPRSLAGAVLLNAWQTTATTMCDVYRPAMCHVSPVVLPALLAGIEARMPSQADALGAFALGLETTVRLCRAMRPDLYQGARWHAPGVIGPFGAATTYALLHGLDDSALRRSWGSAELQSSGTFSAIGSPGVKFTQARGALAGVLAVELALRGHGAAANPFSHPDGGLFDAYGGGDPALATDGLDRDWVLDDISLRRWPAASSLQSLVEAVLALRTDSPELPQSIRIQLPEQSWKLCAGMLWADQLEALQSARWVASVVWADGECWTEQFSTSRIADEELGAFAASRVEVVLDDSLPRGAVRVVAKTAQGAIEHEILTALGSPERPLSRDDVEAKLERAAGRDRALRIRDLLSDDGWDPAGLIRCLAEAPWSATAPPRR